MLQVGIVGYGLSGSIFHAPLIEKTVGMRLHAFVTSKAEQVKADYPEALVCSDIQSLLALEELDLVIVTSPNHLHYEHAKLAIMAGKHVVVEKPFTVASAEAEELIVLARERQVRLSVYQNRRWDNDFKTVREVLAAGLLGRISHYESHFDRYRPQPAVRWKEAPLPGTGILYDLGSHLFDQALQLFGWPLAIWADLKLERDGTQVVDYYHVVLGYEDGLRVILHSGSLVREQGPRFMIHGEKGSFIKHGMDSQEQQLKLGLRPGDPDWAEDAADRYGVLVKDAGGLELRSVVPTLRGSYEDYYALLMESIVNDGKSVPVSPEDGLNTIRLIEYAIQSDREQRRIQLPQA